jgi:hypothetical protein
MTLMTTYDENDQTTTFAARADWTYELRIKPKTPQLVFDQRYGTPLPPLRPREQVLVGLQLEDGPTIERKVKSELDEHGLKLMMWELFGCPLGPLYLHIQNGRDETQFEGRIGPQWRYTIRRQPVNTLRHKQAPRRVDDDADQQRTPPPNASRSSRKEDQASTSGKTPRGQTPQKAEVTRYVTAWCGTRTTNLIVRESIKKGDLIEWIVEQLGEPKGSCTMEVWNTRGALQTEYRVMEGWSYRIFRMSPPGTQEAENQVLRKRGNESRPVLNRSSFTAWQDTPRTEQDRTEARTATSGTGWTSRKTVGLSPRLG